MDPMLEQALAVRMGAARAGDLPIYTWRAGTAVPRGRDVLTLAPHLNAAAIAKAAEKYAQQKGRAPAAVVLAGAGAFVRDNRRDPNPRPRLRNVVTLITGAAQGLGRGIAEALAAEGARVVIGDVNEAAGAAAVAAFDQRFGRGTALFVRLNVAQLDSAQAAGAAAVQRFGGLDMLVSNAGVLKAGGLEELSEADFDFVTAVNYKGFFLCTKAVTPIMRCQHRLNPAHTQDIIQVNSKSGLEGSNRNFAYAGSKFGGIGLVQSFALELVADGIKVNAVCPGNYLDGPLWSDPKRGLFVQYLKAGKVRGAKSVADVRAAYMAKVPMRRGVTPLDLARAIMYLHEQQYETGQALPVTGGQVMLR